MAFPLMVRAIRLSIEAVDRRLEAGGGTLGANRGSGSFLTVTLPLILPGIIAGMILGLRQGDGRIRRDHHLRLQHPRRDADPALGHLHLHAGAGRRRGARLVLVSIVIAMAALLAPKGCRGGGRGWVVE
jgi:molybdate transport system permease protein